MRNLIILTASASVLAAGMAFAGLNPEAPMLPSANYGGTVTTNNQGSSMCVDCHTRIPQVNGGTHFVSLDLTGDTRSSGGWTTTNALENANVRYNAEAGEYFAYETTAWSSGGYSKYFDGTNSVIVPGATANVSTDGDPSTPETITGDPRFLTSVSGIANPAAYDLICESCHNVLVNVAGGNNLLEVPSNGTTWGVAGSTSTPMCIGCHGYMYSDAAIGAQAAPAAFGDTNWAAAVNITSYAGRRGNNETHYIAGLPFAQNHHVMDGDQINAAKIVAGYAWRDVDVYAGSDVAMSMASTAGQYPVDGVWLDQKAGATAFNCANCHTMAHGSKNGTTIAPATLGASILLDTNIVGAAGDQIERISGPNRGWMTFNDTLYCNNCHHLPGAAPSN